MRQIAIYGKGGIGKSTVSSNLSGALNEKGMKVMQIGCDPKRDSTRNLTGGTLIPTVLETYREYLRKGRDEYAISLEDIVVKGTNGVFCVEAGGPEPGIGCAGRGVLTAIQILSDLKAYETYDIDVVIYDVLGDVVCGGFAQPIRQGYAEEIYLLCSGAFMSLYAANNIAKGIQRLSRRGKTGLAGVICNSNGEGQFEAEVIADFAERLGTQLVYFVPRSPVIQTCEVESKTVFEHAPNSEETRKFQELAEKVMKNDSPVIPTPLEELSELEALYRKHLKKY
ncbi:MAG: AAA family ATPase [Dehalococcoidales bacterium]|nr:MAG: AAA family ATPase [Dehalococcoidales bacterium]